MSNETSYLLEEYKELGLSWRRDSDALVKMETIFIPLSIAALTLPYYLKVEIPKLLSVSGGLMLMVYWFIMVCLYMRKLDSWLPRMREIEGHLGFNSQCRYHRRRTTGNRGIIDKGLSFRYLRLQVFRLYVIITLLIMFDIKVEALSKNESTDTKVEATLGVIDVLTTPDLWPTDAWIIKLIFTVETLVFLPIAIIAFFGAMIIYRSCCHFPKKTSPENKT